METIQIIGGGNLQKAFTELNIEAVKLYQSKENWLGEEYQVWELSDEQYIQLDTVEDELWISEYGWWRNSGCNDTSEIIEFEINDEKMLGFKNEYSWYHSEDYYSEFEEGEKIPPVSYESVLDWFADYQGLSKPENFSYCVTSLAKVNNLSKSDFLHKYLG